MTEETQANAGGSVLSKRTKKPPAEDDQEPIGDHTYGGEAAGAEDAAAAAEPPGH